MSFEITITFAELFASFPEPYSHKPVAMLQKTLMACAFWLFVCGFSRAILPFTRFVKDLQPHEYKQWAMKICCVLHSTIQGLLGLYLFLYDPVVSGQVSRFLKGEEYDVITSTSPNIACYFPLTLGYFLYELVCLPLWWSPKEAPMVFHHIVPQLLIITPCFDLVSCFFLVTELSTPFVQGRWFIEKHLSRTHPLYTINGAFMVLSFFILRVVTVPHYHMCLLGNNHVLATRPPHEQVFGWLFHLPSLLNIYWFKLIVDGLLKMLFSKKSDKLEKKQQ